MNDDDQPRPRLWPLHPRPHEYEPLGFWVERLAVAYGIPHLVFCQHALGLTRNETHLLGNKPPAHVLATLAEGTGVPIERLRQMTASAILEQCQRHLDHHLLENESEWARWLSEQGQDRIWRHWSRSQYPKWMQEEQQEYVNAIWKAWCDSMTDVPL